MSKANRTYIDDEGVIRGYYVYIHRRSGGEVFYVGKGQGRRAWDKAARSEGWKKLVADLADNWEVEIVDHDLTEHEAFELEAELVEKFGGSKFEGGRLTNLVPGGESPSAGVVLRLPESLVASTDAYESARRFKGLSRHNQEGVAQQLKCDLEATIDALDELRDSEELDDGDPLDESVFALDCILGSMVSASQEFLRRRTSWRRFALAFEEMLEDLQPDDIKAHPESVQTIAMPIIASATKLFETFDSGNREEAERFANKVSDER